MTESKMKVLAALVEAKGDVSEAARLAGVSKQYIYEVLGALKRVGVRLRGYPFLSSLGRVFIIFCKHQLSNNSSLLVFQLRVYRFVGDIVTVGVYMVPSSSNFASEYLGLRGMLVEELLDVYAAAPRYDISYIKPQRDVLLPRPPKVELDDEDRAILLHLYEDIFAHVTESKTTASKSRLSYHYRSHVKKILQVMIDFHPEKMHINPLLLAEVKAPSEEWIATLLRARQVYILMPKLDGLSAYVLLEADDPYSLIRKVAVAREERGLELEVRMVGYVDLDESMKPRLPPVIAYAGLRTA